MVHDLNLTPTGWELRDREEIRQFLERLARDAGLRRPAELSRELMVVYDGAVATAVVQENPAVGKTAAEAARLLIEAHTPAQRDERWSSCRLCITRA